MEDTLKERFDALLKEWGFDENYPTGIGYITAAMQQAYNLALSERWVDVKDRLPEFQSPVIVYTINGYTQTAFFEEDSNSWVGIGNFRAPKVTHWQPLPTPPQTN